VKKKKRVECGLALASTPPATTPPGSCHSALWCVLGAPAACLHRAAGLAPLLEERTDCQVLPLHLSASRALLLLRRKRFDAQTQRCVSVAQLKPIGYNLSYLVCRIRRLAVVVPCG
jgi:hypothetical protein